MKRNEQNEQPTDRKFRAGRVAAGMIIVLLIAGILVVMTQFKVESVQVTGNIHYTEEEIIQMVMGDNHSQNTLLLYLKYKLQPMEEIPFIEKIDVEYISNHVLTITVYEKALAGCIRFMDEYMYFDKDGVVLESSQEKMADIP